MYRTCRVTAAASVKYHPGFVDTQVGCGAVPDVEVQLELRRFGTFSGKVTIGQADPNDLTTARHITDTGVPIDGAVAQVSTVSSFTTTSTGADGNWISDSIPLQPPALTQNANVTLTAQH